MSELPRRINVKEIVESRYAPGERPVLWGDRRQGLEIVVDENGDRIALLSTGGQPSPAVGWQLVLTGLVALTDGALTDGEGAVSAETTENAHAWTLYGL